MLGVGATNSLQSVMAQTQDNNTNGTGNSTDKGEHMHSLAQHLDNKLGVMQNMTEKIRSELNATHNMTEQMEEKLSGIHNMTEKIDDRLAAMHNRTLTFQQIQSNRTAEIKQMQVFDAAVKQATQSYNDAIKQAYKQANTALTQARNNMTDSIKQVQDAVLQAKKSSDNSTSGPGENATKYGKANTAYKAALKQYNEAYRTAITNAINESKSNIAQVQQGLKSENNGTHGVPISSRASADKSYFEIKDTEIKSIADATFTLRVNDIQAMLTGFASVTGDNPTLDSAGQTYTNNVNSIEANFNAALDAANSAAQSAIDAAAAQ